MFKTGDKVRLKEGPLSRGYMATRNDIAKVSETKEHHKHNRWVNLHWNSDAIQSHGAYPKEDFELSIPQQVATRRFEQILTEIRGEQDGTYDKFEAP